MKEIQTPFSTPPRQQSSQTPSADAAHGPQSGAVQANSRWNTRNLGLRIGSDLLSAASSGGLVAPVITMIDRAIIENASGRSPLLQSLRTSLTTLLLRPQHFILSRPFFLIFTLYTGTYFSANTLDTVVSTTTDAPASTVTAGPSKFAATSTCNLALCLYKDSQFTRLFGAVGAPAAKIPAATYALFTLRDSLTIFASFNVPPLLAPHIRQRVDKAVGTLGSALRKHVDAASAAQFIAPAAVQVLSTPLHLLGLDLYNRPAGSVRWTERASKVAREWGPSFLARIGRIVPAFGFGGVVNMKVRRQLMGRLE